MTTLAARFLHRIDHDPALQSLIEAADGDLDAMLQGAAQAGFRLDADKLRRACEAATAEVQARQAWTGHPAVYVAHPMVYLA